MKTVWAITFLAFMFVLGCGRRNAANKGLVADLSSFHGELLAALAKRHWSDGGLESETCILEPETTIWGGYSDVKEPDRWKAFQAGLPALRRDTYDSLWIENERARPVAPTSNGPMKLHVLTKAEDAELDAIARDGRLEDYWGTFRARYGYAPRVGLSAPGFSKDGKQAVIYYQEVGDVLAGAGFLCLLSRKGDRWEIDEVCCVWQA